MTTKQLECPECGHAAEHYPNGCEFERGDKWVDFGNGERLVAMGLCGCTAVICPRCECSGEYNGKPCALCDGTGTVQEDRR